MSRDKFGQAYTPWENILHLKKKKQNWIEVQGFYCRACSKSFPDSMKPEIWKWLKFKDVLKRLQE